MSSRSSAAVLRAAAAALALGLPALALAVPALAQDEPQTRTVAPGPHYRAGGFHRTMLGSSYRELWSTPVTVEVLDLAREAGGLSVVRRVGGQQTLGQLPQGGEFRRAQSG